LCSYVKQKVFKGSRIESKASFLVGFRAVSREKVAWVLQELRAAIDERGISLAEVSRRLGWQERKVSQVLRGIPRPRLDLLFEVLGGAGISERDFFARLAGGPGDDVLEMMDHISSLEAVRRRIEARRPAGAPGDFKEERR
jgi:transcriptional regulator with XRE-family HTH domain